MNLVSGEAIWTKINPVLHKYSYLSDDIECDVLVMGAGITGAICAYYFTEAGINTVIVDKNIVGYGSTSASTSLLQYEVDYNLYELQGKIGMDNAVKSFKLCEKAVYDIEAVVDKLKEQCGFERKDCVYYTPDKADADTLKKEYELRSSHGFPVEYLDKKAAKDRFSFPVEAAIYSPFGAGQIDPYLFAHALIDHAAGNGLQVFENTEITDMQHKKNAVVLVTNNNKRVTAKKVLIATGFEAKKYIKEHIAIMSRTFTIATRPVQSFEGWYNTCLIRDNNEAYIYLRTTSDKRMMIGGEDMSIGGKNSRMAKGDDNEDVAEEKYRLLENRLRTFFPGISHIEIDIRFNGLFASTKDGLPYIGKYKGMPDCYFCLGYGSNGILYAILGGQMLRDLYMGKDVPELQLFRFGR